MLIGVDFDHTIVHGNEPLPKAKYALAFLKEQGHKIIIYSCNNRSWMESTLKLHEIPYDYISTEGKPNCAIYVDDRGYRFKGDWMEALPEIMELLSNEK